MAWMKMLWQTSIVPTPINKLYGCWVTMQNEPFFSVTINEQTINVTKPIFEMTDMPPIPPDTEPYVPKYKFNMSPISYFAVVAVRYGDSWKYALLITGIALSPSSNSAGVPDKYRHYIEDVPMPDGSVQKSRVYPSVKWQKSDALGSFGYGRYKRNSSDTDWTLDAFSRTVVYPTYPTWELNESINYFNAWCYSGGILSRDIVLLFDEDCEFTPDCGLDNLIYIDEVNENNIKTAIQQIFQKAYLLPFAEKYQLGRYDFPLADPGDTLIWFFGWALSTRLYDYGYDFNTGRRWINEFSDNAYPIIDEFVRRIGDDNLIMIEISEDVWDVTEHYVLVRHKKVSGNTINLDLNVVSISSSTKYCGLYGYFNEQPGSINSKLTDYTTDICDFTFDSSSHDYTHSFSTVTNEPPITLLLNVCGGSEGGKDEGYARGTDYSRRVRLCNIGFLLEHIL